MTPHLTSTDYEHIVPNVFNADVNMDTSGAKFVPIVGLTHDDDDTKSHMCEISSELPASANFPLNIPALATLSQVGATPCEMFTVFSRYQIKQICILGNSKIIKGYLQFLNLKKRFSCLHNELENPCTISGKRFDVLHSINYKRISCCHSSI